MLDTAPVACPYELTGLQGIVLDPHSRARAWGLKNAPLSGLQSSALGEEAPLESIHEAAPLLALLLAPRLGLARCIGGTRPARVACLRPLALLHRRSQVGVASEMLRLHLLQGGHGHLRFPLANPTI